ncbi:MAG: hypothetical protein M0Z66_06105 [Thermaerobacter sp.]|nr:hypothetical protein [Thermaerobacter sp.]
MSAQMRIARLHRVRGHERSAASSRLQEAIQALCEAQAAAQATRQAREAAEQAAAAAGMEPQTADRWLSQRALVEGRLERERLADLQVRRLGRQEALRRVDLRAALVREEQMRLLGSQILERRQDAAQRTEQKTLDDLRREGGGGR